MIIETKFNVGDTVYVADGMKIIETMVERISFESEACCKCLGYKTRYLQGNLSEDRLFATKEDLKNHLIEEIKSL